MCHVGSLCRGPKYSLLAHTSLTLQHVQEAFKSHDLSLAATGSSCTSSAFARALSSPLIPSLYLCFQRRMLSGCPCMATCAAAWSPSLSASFSLSLAAGCRLRCQDFAPWLPVNAASCFTPWPLPSVSSSWGRALTAGKMSTASSGGQELLCFQSPEDLEGEDKPSVVIPIKKVCPEHVGGRISGFGLSSQKCSEGNGVIVCLTSQVPHWC